MAETDKTGETTGRAGCGHKPARLRAQVCPPKGTGVLPCGQRCAPKRKEEPHPVAWLRRTPPDGYALRRACNLRLFRRRYQRHISRETKVDKGGAYPISCKSAGSNCPNR